MFAFLKFRWLFFGMLLATPVLGLWALQSGPPAALFTEARPVSSGAEVPPTADVTRVPVEVISKGSAPEWVYVEVDNQAVPEPGILPLIILTGAILAFRRQRT